MNGSQLQNRPLRVKRAVQKQKLEKKFRKVAEKKLNKKGYTPPQNKNRQFKGEPAVFRRPGEGGAGQAEGD